MRVNQTCGEARRLSSLARTVQRQKLSNVKPTSFSRSGLLDKQGDVPATGKPTQEAFSPTPAYWPCSFKTKPRAGSGVCQCSKQLEAAKFSGLSHARRNPDAAFLR